MRIAFKWGSLLALAIILWTAAVHLLGIYTTRIQYAATVDMVVMILPLAIITLALLEYRRANNGVLPFGRGVLVGTGVAAFSAPPTIAAMWFYHHFVNPEWVSYLVNYEQQKLAAAGATAETIAAAVTRLQQGGADQAQITGGLVGTVVMGLVLSVVITGILKLAARPR